MGLFHTLHYRYRPPQASLPTLLGDKRKLPYRKHRPFASCLGCARNLLLHPLVLLTLGKEGFTPWVVLMLLPPCSWLSTLQLGKRVRWWQWPRAPVCLFSPPARLGSRHPQMKKGLIIPLPTFREFCIHSALWAFALPWPRRKMTAPPISSWILPSAPYPQATVNQSAMKQLTLLPPPWLGFGAKWHTSGTHTSPSI